MGWLSLLLALLPLHADAHLGGVKTDDFWLGVLHPLTTLENALAMLALGLLAGQNGEKAGLRVAGVFALAMTAGAVLGMLGLAGGWATWASLLSLIVLGGLVALALPLGLPLLIGLAALGGLAHGATNGAEIVPPVKPLLFIAGLTIAGFMATFYAMFVVLHLKPWWTRIGVRVAGSWIAANGLLVAALNSLGKPSGL